MSLRRKLTTTQIITLGFLLIILAGSILLCFPFATKSRTAAPYIDCLFTAASATCVTGLASVPTTDWSVYGQLVILVLIQIGGLGFMTFVTLITFFIRKQFGLFDRKIFMQSAGIMNLGSVLTLFKQILFGTLMIEGAGTVLLSIAFVPQYGWVGLYYALFHSVSAFCNAGFDLFGNSLVSYYSNPLVILTISVLIILGGLGFIVWSNVIETKFRFKRFNLHTKIVLIATTVLLVVPTFLFLGMDWNYSLDNMTFGQKLLSSFFQTVSPRTAGFYSIDLTEISNGSYILSIILMFIGGSSGSTAGGIKTTTLVIILFSVIAEVRKSDNIIIGKRTMPQGIAKSASAVLALYLIGAATATAIICTAEPILALDAVFYEVVSAVCTVGLSLGITSEIGVISKIVLILLMFIGRVGSVSVAMSFGEKKENPPLEYPTEKIMIG